MSFRISYRWAFIWLCFGLYGCLGRAPVTPVSGFDVTAYMGRWYEIARLNHSFERGLDPVYADYQLLPNGRVSVLNRGFDASTKEWKEAKGKAKWVGESTKEGVLEISFFGPFYGDYIIFEQGDGYAFVASSSTRYLWLLSRSPKVSPELIERLKAPAK